MLKNHQKEITIAHKSIDLLIVAASWFASYLIRFESIIPDAQEGLEVWYLKYGLVLLFLNYYYFRRFGLYTSKRFGTLLKETSNVFKANLSAVFVFVIIVYFFSTHKISRFTVTSHFIFSTFLLISFKVNLRKFLRKLREKGKNLRHVILVGNGPQLLRYLDKINSNKELGIVVKGWFDSDSLCDHSNLNCIATFSNDLLKEYCPDSVIIGYKNKDSGKAEDVLKTLKNELFETVVLPDLSYSLIGYNISNISGIPAIMINEPEIKSQSVIAKRLFDIAFSLIGMIILSPLFLLISLIVKLSSKGPVFYSQVRMGLDGKRFKMYKFRSMAMGNDNETGWTTKNDPRITKIGAILRKTSLDEFPQLWNVFIGDMSLVGPRPERPMYVEKFKEEIPNYMLRHKMKAGITGWAQINGWRGDTSISKRIECDLFYIKNWSLWMDISIILMTFWKGFVNKNAY